MDHLGDVRGPDGLEELERRLAVLCWAQRPLRAAVARVAWLVVDTCAWERIGFARLSDYAVERLGISGRSLQTLARVGRAFLGRPSLEQALVSGRLGWTKVRLLASLPPEEDVEPWIARAERLSAERLAKRVRAVDRHSADEDVTELAAGAGALELRCSPEVRRKWGAAQGVASRAAGRRLGLAEAAEVIAAEVLSALPVDAPDDDATRDEATSGDPASPPGSHPADEGPEVRRRSPVSAPEPGPPPPELSQLRDDLDDGDAFALDARLRSALAREQSLDTRVAPLLVLAWQPGVHRALGYTTREGWVRERLEMDPTRARALVRLERACATSPALARAWRGLALSWPRAEALVPLVSADALGRFTDDWVHWARRVTVRRLRDDAERAVELAETDPAAFRREGGLPPEARQCRLPAGDLQDGTLTRREIGAGVRDAEGKHTRPGPDAAEAPMAPEPGIGADLRDDEGEHPRPGPDAAEPPTAHEREIGADRRGAEGEPTRPGPDAAEAPMAPEREIGANRRDPEREAPPHYPAPGARAHAGLGGRPDPTRRAGSA